MRRLEDKRVRNGKGRRAEDGGREKTEVRGQISEDRNQRSEVRGRRTVVRGLRFNRVKMLISRDCEL